MWRYWNWFGTSITVGQILSVVSNPLLGKVGLICITGIAVWWATAENLSTGKTFVWKIPPSSCRVSSSPVYTIQTVVKRVVKPVGQPGKCLYTGYNRLSNPFDNRLTTGWMFVYTIQPVVKPVVQPVWQPVVSCKRGFTQPSMLKHWRKQNTDPNKWPDPQPVTWLHSFFIQPPDFWWNGRWSLYADGLIIMENSAVRNPWQSLIILVSGLHSVSTFCCTTCSVVGCDCVWWVQLLLGSADNQLSQFHLSRKPDSYFYTSQGGGSKVWSIVPVDSSNTRSFNDLPGFVLVLN